MKVEDYLDLNDPDGIRIAGHRIWLNHLLYEVVYNGATAEQLLERFPTLSMEKIYFALAYFERNKAELMRLFLEDLDRQQRNYAAHAEESRARLAELHRRAYLAPKKEVG